MRESTRKKGKKSLRLDPRSEQSSRDRATKSWVKHGHKKLYLLGGAVLIAVILGAWALSSSSARTPLKVGDTAPNFIFTTLDGSPSNLRAYIGHPVVLWWIATWCTSCQDGTRLFAQNYYKQYNASGVVLLQIESYNNLGQPGPDLPTFASSYGYAGQKNWIMGAGSQDGTATYNSPGYLDYYYLISSKGVILDAKAGLPQYFGTVLQDAAGH